MVDPHDKGRTIPLSLGDHPPDHNLDTLKRDGINLADLDEPERIQIGPLDV